MKVPPSAEPSPFFLTTAIDLYCTAVISRIQYGGRQVNKVVSETFTFPAKCER